ncbi:MAG: hypothetical protein ABIA78_04300 [archaeon]
MQEEENILRILEETKTAVQNNDTFKIKQLSDQTNNTVARTQDPDNIAVAVIVYAIGKILERGYQNQNGWDIFYKNMLVYLDKAIVSIKSKKPEEFSRSLELMRGSITKLSGNLKKYISDVFRKASINKASKIYEHGISMEKTASLLGITMFELASYAGEREIADTPESNTLGVKQRIKLAMEMFG